MIYRKDNVEVFMKCPCWVLRLKYTTPVYSSCLVMAVSTGSDRGFLLVHNRARPASLKSWWEQ